ncbi:hypothetical protein [Streptomyces sp. NBC_00038]|uniref:hypothetical protein n=1 Tax=Streptomyces sp. NBC_00038 TaxID=2903615 RepID=UPI002253D758|nr:hypothetical protein [Streptomyces sp. NBC_00038]MCX5555331.1 hypothetical protein [Streptomyces sp. NBC_00038]
MPDPTDLAAADQMIEAAWGYTLDDLHTCLRDGKVNDPALVAVLRIRGALEIDDSDITNHRERVHRFTRAGRVPLFHDLKGIGSSSSDLLTAHASSQARVHAVRSIIDAYPEGYLAEGLARSLTRSAEPRAEAALARSGAPATNPPRDQPSVDTAAHQNVPHNRSRSAQR